jgi:hypothetical protein
MRNLAEGVSPETVSTLELLINKKTSRRAYGDAFYRLGQLLAQRLSEADLGKKVLLVCTSEDADFLARGLFESIKKPNPSNRSFLAFACLWQERFDPVPNGLHRKRFEVAPIIKRYEEPTDDNIDSLIVVKSIIASSCVVRHALLDTIARKHPKRIFVVSPVIAKGAPESLQAEFPRKVASLFRFVYFAEDDSPDADGMVWPGIGGNVHQRLPLPKTRGILMPKIVAERRNRLLEANV